MITRVITATVLLFITIGVFALLPAFPYVHIASFLLLLVAAWEWSGFCYQKPLWRVSYALFCGMLFFLVLLMELHVMIIAICAILWVLGVLRLYRFDGTMQSIPVLLLSGLMLINGLALAILYLRELSVTALFLLFFIVWGADIFGLLVGKKCGHEKLVPHISPGKTWQGVYGALMYGFFFTLMVAFLYDLPMLTTLGVVLLTVLISIVGDLFVSCYKREVGVKDTGRIFPGHGGLLDRLDGLLAAAPFFIAACWYADIDLAHLQISF